MTHEDKALKRYYDVRCTKMRPPCFACNGRKVVLANPGRPVTEYDLPEYVACAHCNGLGYIYKRY